MNSDDLKLFRSTVGKVTPIKHGKTIQKTVKPKPIPVQTYNTHRQLLHEMANGVPDVTNIETGDELLFKRPGLQNRVLKKLRRGEYRIEEQLDLHGLVVAQAMKVAARFITNARKRNIRCVRIIHGKGLGSARGNPKIKHNINVLLRHRDDILAFCSALPRDGGTGAVYVLLKR